MKKFNFYEVRDVRELLKRLDTDTDDENEYRLKPLYKKNKQNIYSNLNTVSFL